MRVAKNCYDVALDDPFFLSAPIYKLYHNDLYIKNENNNSSENYDFTMNSASTIISVGLDVFGVSNIDIVVPDTEENIAE